MVARLDHLIIIIYVCFMFVYGQHSLNVSELYATSESFAQIDVLNNSDIDHESIEVDNVRSNESIWYTSKMDGNLTDAVLSNDSIDSGDFNETESSNSSMATAKPLKENCTVCAMREDDRKFRIDAIKHRILDNLHLQTPPNMTGRTLPKVPLFAQLLERSEIQSDSPSYQGNYDHYEYDDPYSYTESIFTIAKAPPPDLMMNESHVSYFSLPRETRDSTVQKAVLWYYMKPTNQREQVKVHIHKLQPPKSADSPPPKKPLRYWKLFPKKARNWHQLDIQKVVQEWVDSPYSNFGLQLTAFDHNKDNLIINPPPGDGEEGYEPMLELQVIKRNPRRFKRNAMICSANSTERRCCRYPLQVSFIDFGWDWVIAPREYSADYCSGECRFTLQAENHHSYMQQQAGPTGPCCTPTMLSALSMLYFDHEHNILYTSLQDMKVERCGCS